MKFLILCVFIVLIGKLFNNYLPKLKTSKLDKSLNSNKEKLNTLIPIISDELEYIKTLSLNPDIEDSFHVINLSSLEDRMMLWKQYLPYVNVFYAVKTNHDPVITSVLYSLGAGFDCASIAEMQQVLNQGVSPQAIIFSHPRKPNKEIKFAEHHQIRLMVFDSSEELEKMSLHAPSGDYLLRIKTNDENSEVPLSSKFGANLDKAYELLDFAHRIGANVKGISFHVGSNNQDAMAFTQALQDTSLLFQYYEKKWGKTLSIIDVGGGWPGDNDELFIHFAMTLTQGLNQYFTEDIEVIAEPGRFFAAKTTTIVTRIIGRELIETEEEPVYNYYLANGVYGFFASSLYYQHDPRKIAMENWSFQPLFPKDNSSERRKSTLWGPTCDAGDKILEHTFFPIMETNEFIYTKNSGAYTFTGQTAFNQITPSKAYYIQTM